ncbi:orotidine 5'-phosphate decarboxylase [candidate division WOR-3 bacterium RBG_13_43_14]|uniref:Orotidine 5'-phosphate decarboxylase n=1 Tax=candidate division WOR-3 bacterium RBG_13_43_14 TaxID=1802590 RepID=A0A1F4UEY6_UNCW3|nr:MAG: orotidine 5'-phosphate decarboxylase [candidate division WOR-3 bacterium RBG_13_43_14]
MSEQKLIVSLDLSDLGKIKNLVNQLKGIIEIFKVGAIPFTYFGTEIVRWLKDNDCRVMLDLKYHDIPNTVARACEGAMELGVDMLTIHTSGGFSMLEEAVKATLVTADIKKIDRPRLLGVTVLTSIDEAYFKDLFGDIKRSLEEQVVFFAQLARSAGLDGVVASPNEIEAIRKACGDELLIVTPGIRVQEEVIEADDQARVTTPRAAFEAGANFIVIGRPIVRAKDPVAAAEKILKEIDEGN